MLDNRLTYVAADILGEAGRSDEQQLPFKGATFSDWLNDVFDALNIVKAR